MYLTATGKDGTQFTVFIDNTGIMNEGGIDHRLHSVELKEVVEYYQPRYHDAPHLTGTPTITRVLCAVDDWGTAFEDPIQNIVFYED